MGDALFVEKISILIKKSRSVYARTRTMN